MVRIEDSAVYFRLVGCCYFKDSSSRTSRKIELTSLSCSFQVGRETFPMMTVLIHSTAGSAAWAVRSSLALSVYLCAVNNDTHHSKPKCPIIKLQNSGIFSFYNLFNVNREIIFCSFVSFRCRSWRNLIQLSYPLAISIYLSSMKPLGLFQMERTLRQGFVTSPFVLFNSRVSKHL